MIKILCLVKNLAEIEDIKKRIQHSIFSSNRLPIRQKYVMPGGINKPMFTDNCFIDFCLPDPDKTGGLRADIVTGVFDSEYSDDFINLITGKSNLELQKKYGNIGWPVWDIVLDIEERYAKAMEEMFNDYEAIREITDVKFTGMALMPDGSMEMEGIIYD